MDAMAQAKRKTEELRRLLSLTRNLLRLSRSIPSLLHFPEEDYREKEEAFLQYAAQLLEESGGLLSE